MPRQGPQVPRLQQLAQPSAFPTTSILLALCFPTALPQEWQSGPMPGWVPALRLPAPTPHSGRALTPFFPPLPVKALPDSPEVGVMPLAMDQDRVAPQPRHTAFPQRPPSQPRPGRRFRDPQIPPEPFPTGRDVPEALPNPTKASRCIFGCQLMASPPASASAAALGQQSCFQQDMSAPLTISAWPACAGTCVTPTC